MQEVQLVNVVHYEQLAGQFVHTPYWLNFLLGHGSMHRLFYRYLLVQLKQVEDELTQVLQRPIQPMQVCDMASMYKPLPQS